MSFATMRSSLSRGVAQLLSGREASPAIRVTGFPRRHPELFAPAAPAVEGRALVSQVCRLATLDSPTFRDWLGRLRDGWHLHRKNWEHAYICQALHERGLLAPGRRGLGFAVGAEKLPAFFASLGCRITATDLATDDDRSRRWANTGQWTGNLDALNAHGLCPADVFRERVEFRPVDMNHVPDDLRDYDFTWSTCSFEHCGSLDLGLAFLERQLDCLRPGGVAVHTTEFNLSSNDRTVATGPNVIYRLRDIEDFVLRMRSLGHHVEPLDVDPGDAAADRFVDPPPYHGSTGRGPGGIKHMRLNLDGYASTSIGLILRRAA